MDFERLQKQIEQKLLNDQTRVTTARLVQQYLSVEFLNVTGVSDSSL